MTDDLRRSHRRYWALDPDVAFCNHGSFGACPRAVLDVQRRLSDEMESDPVRFLARRAADALDEARDRLASFVGADPAGVVFVRNATTGVNTVLRSCSLGAGDEILLTDHGYEAVRLAAARVAAATGATVRVARIPVPVGSPSDVLEAVTAAVTRRTRLAIIDHVTSPTGLVVPIAGIVAVLAERGVDVLVDGAHAPGQVDVEVEAIGAAAYTGNCHKWMCAPKGAGFLWLRDDLRDRIRPLVVSHGEGHGRPGRSRLHDRFDWIGTEDPTPYLCVPAAIDHVGSLLDGGWAAVRDRNRRLALAGRELLIGHGMEPVGPAEMVGSMAAVVIGRTDPGAARETANRLSALLYDEHGVQAPVTWRHGADELMLRLSAHLHTSLDDLERLAAAAVEVGRRRADDEGTAGSFRDR